jgi:hypothetical protein
MPETALHNAIKPDGVELSFDDFKNIVINDYRVAFESRQASLLGRREVLTGKAKFGIFGDGKELLPRPNLYVCNRHEQPEGVFRAVVCHA